MNPKTQTLKSVTALLMAGDSDQARSALLSEYPSPSTKRVKRAYTPKESMAVFRRDGFVDRYSGTQLVFPGTLRLIHKLLPTEFPFHKNWKMSETHIAFWQLFPTIDHIVPVARNGPDTFDNWVTTSQIKNSVKSNWLLEELEWKLRDPGDIAEWDGLTSWSIEYVTKHPEHLADSYISTWHRAATAGSQKQ